MSNPLRNRTVIEVSVTAVITFLISLVALSPTLSYLDNAWADGDMLSTYVNVDNWGVARLHQRESLRVPVWHGPWSFSPTLDITQNIFASVVSGLSGNPYLGINLLLVLSFPLVALLAYFSIRLTGLRGPLAIALATAFTFIPFSPLVAALVTPTSPQFTALSLR